MLLEELLKCQAAYERTLFMSSLCPNSFCIPQDYHFLNCFRKKKLKKKKKAQSSQVDNLNAKSLPAFTFSSLVLNH